MYLCVVEIVFGNILFTATKRIQSIGGLNNKAAFGFVPVSLLFQLTPVSMEIRLEALFTEERASLMC